MRVKGITPININRDIIMDIPDIVERICRDVAVGNVIIVVSGLGQHGKSNFAEWLRIELQKKLKRKFMRTFNDEKFIIGATDKNNPEMIIEYDEIQNDIEAFWSITYQRLKQI